MNGERTGDRKNVSGRMMDEEAAKKYRASLIRRGIIKEGRPLSDEEVAAFERQRLIDKGVLIPAEESTIL